MISSHMPLERSVITSENPYFYEQEVKTCEDLSQ